MSQDIKFFITKSCNCEICDITHTIKKSVNDKTLKWNFVARHVDISAILESLSMGCCGLLDDHPVKRLAKMALVSLERLVIVYLKFW